MLIILGGCVNVYTPRIPEANLCYHLSRVMVLSVLQSEVLHGMDLGFPPEKIVFDSPVKTEPELSMTTIEYYLKD